MVFLKKDNKIYLLIKYHIFRKDVWLRKGGHTMPIYSGALLNILAFEMRRTVCGCAFLPVNLPRRDWRGSEPPLHCALIISSNWMVFLKASLYCMCRYVTGTVLSTLQAYSLIFTTCLWGRHSSHLEFAGTGQRPERGCTDWWSRI